MSQEHLKVCSRCKESKPQDAFRRARTRDGLYGYCRSCCAAMQREYRQRNLEQLRAYDRARRSADPEKYRKRDRRRWRDKRAAQDRASRRRFALKVFDKYSLTLDEYDALVNAPCAICGATGDIVLDHCHGTGKLRGPLCRVCNIGIGHLRDDPSLLRAAAAYIEKHR